MTFLIVSLGAQIARVDNYKKTYSTRMRSSPIKSLVPIIITGITSVLFFGGYDRAYAISMLTGLLIFFYFAECLTAAAIALKTRRLHYRAIPYRIIKTHIPSLIAIAAATLIGPSHTVRNLITGNAALGISALFLWILIWGLSRFISRKIAGQPYFLPAIQYGINMLAFITPVFYPLNAVRLESLRVALGYNPLAVAIMATRGAFLADYSAISGTAVATSIILSLTVAILGYYRKDSST